MPFAIQDQILEGGAPVEVQVRMNLPRNNEFPKPTLVRLTYQTTISVRPQHVSVQLWCKMSKYHNMTDCDGGIMTHP